MVLTSFKLPNIDAFSKRSQLPKIPCVQYSYFCPD